MVKAEIHSLPLEITFQAVAHADIMNKAHAEIKTVEEIIVRGDIDAMMSGVIRIIRRTL